MKLRFLNIIFLLLTLILPTTYFAHIDIFDIYQGQFIPNQKWNKNFCFDIEFQNNIHIDEIGIDYFDVGENDSSLIEILIFDNTNKIFTIKKRIDKIYNQTLLLPINKYLKKGQYRIQINNFDNDDVITLFKPNAIPLEIKLNKIKTNNIYTIENSTLLKSINHPFIHFGGKYQDGINLAIGNKFIGFTNQVNGYELIFTPLENQTCVNIGLNNYNLDTGIISLKFYNNITNELVFSKDTILPKNNTSVSFNLNSNIEKNINYKVQINFEKYNKLYLNQFTNIPEYDNTNQIKIIQFNSKKISSNEFIKDTIGYVLTFKFEDKTLNFQNNLSNENENEYYILDKTLYVKNNNANNEPYLYDILGKTIKSENKIDYDEIYTKFKLINAGIYFLKNNSKTFKFYFNYD